MGRTQRARAGASWFIHCAALASALTAQRASTIATPRWVTPLGNSSSSHWWFPEDWAAFDGGETIAVKVRLMDDSALCNASSRCAGCHDAGRHACSNPHARYRTLLSRDYGASWARADGTNGTAALLSDEKDERAEQ